MHVAGYFRKRRYFFGIRLPSVDTLPAFSGTENGGLQKHSPGWRLLKTEMSRSCVRKWGFSNTMTSYLGSSLAQIPHIHSKMLTCGGRFFKDGGKSLRFRNTRLRVDGQIPLENTTCERRFF